MPERAPSLSSEPAPVRAVVFVNGVVQDYAQLRRWLRPEDRLIAADGGARHVLALGVRPHVVVGDLDSLDPALVEGLAAQGVLFEQHPIGKDATDLELAVERAIADGAHSILLLGALGGRLDQTIANVLILAQREWPVPVTLVEEEQVAAVVRGGETLTLMAPVGGTVSLVPLSAQVTGITYRGLVYPLVNATLALGSTRGISNEVAEPGATIYIEGGIALVVQTAPDPGGLSDAAERKRR
jgi:thiamine pyrophosphokinase